MCSLPHTIEMGLRLLPSNNHNYYSHNDYDNYSSIYIQSGNAVLTNAGAESLSHSDYIVCDTPFLCREVCVRSGNSFLDIDNNVLKHFTTEFNPFDVSDHGDLIDLPKGMLSTLNSLKSFKITDNVCYVGNRKPFNVYFPDIEYTFPEKSKIYKKAIKTIQYNSRYIKISFKRGLNLFILTKEGLCT